MDFLSKWDHMPWKHWNPPSERFKELPTFVIGEYLVYFLTLVTLWHAKKHGRQHLLVWLAALITGSANDIFFMALPFVDNFWQAQATIMITPRLPLYIPCVYIVFLYTSTVTVWRLGLSRLSEAALTGLVALLIYGPYDITGIKFLWWTWHDTDPPIKNRILGVPVGSSLWIFTFSASFSFLLRSLYLNRSRAFQSRSLITYITVLSLSALLTTPLMMVQMALLQAIAFDVQGAPSHRCFAICGLIYALIIAYCFPNRCLDRHPAGPILDKAWSAGRWVDRVLSFGLMVHFASLVMIMGLGKPENHISTGVHQAYGPCGIKVVDLTGLSRDKYVCAEEMSQDWDFRCSNNGLPPPASPPTDWYTVCGKAHTDFNLWMAAVGGFTLIGHFFYSCVLGHPFAITSGTRRNKKNC